MPHRVPHPRSETEVRQTFQRLVNQTDVLIQGASGQLLVGAGIGVTPVWTNQSAIDHGGFGGLTDDDHTQYHTNARGDARYYTETELDAGQLDNRYFTETEHIASSAGAADAGKPIKLDTDGHVDATMINDADVDHGSIGGLAGDDHTQYLLADGTRQLSGNLSVAAEVTIDGRDLSVDGTKLDGIEAGADITDAENVAGAGAAMAGGAFHDGFSDFVAAEHVSLPNLIANVLSDHNLAAHTALGLFDASSDVDHDQTTNYDANKHVDHTAVSISAGDGLTGGGDISANRTISLSGFTTRMRATAAASQDVPASEWTKIILGNEEYDGGGDFADSTFTAPATGRYLCCCGLRMNEPLKLNGAFYIGFYVNGVWKVGRSLQNLYTGTYYMEGRVVDIIELEEGDEVELWTYHDHTEARLYHGSHYVNMAIHRLS